MPASAIAFSIISFRPLFSIETVSYTGQPSFSESFFASIFVPSFSLISVLLSATTTGMPSSSSCVVKKSDLLRFVASTMFTIASGFAVLTYSLVMPSSGVKGDIE